MRAATLVDGVEGKKGDGRGRLGGLECQKCSAPDAAYKLAALKGFTRGQQITKTSSQLPAGRLISYTATKQNTPQGLNESSGYHTSPPTPTP